MVAILVWNTILVLLVSCCVADGAIRCSVKNPCIEDLGQGKDFAEPEQLRSTKRQWGFCLNVDIGEVKFGWLVLKRRLYNGRPIGPTWNVMPNSRIQVDLTNKLADINNDDKPPGSMKYPNTTNLHTHGLHISSKEPQDNVGIAVKPGETYRYKYRLHEHNPPGTCWYHAHVHGSTMFQVTSGLAGMLIVKDKIKELLRFPQLYDASCPKNCKYDIQMVFQSTLQFTGFSGFGNIQETIGDDPNFRFDDTYTDDGITLTKWLSDNVNMAVTNGLNQPVLRIRERKLHRFRMVNACGADTLEVFITDKGTEKATTACEIREIALDGIYLNRPRKLHQGQSFMVPGNRIDWLVKCNKSGTYELRSYPNPINEKSTGSINRFSGLLVTIEVEEFYPQRKTQINTAFPEFLPPRPTFLTDLRHKRVDQRFVLELNSGLQLGRSSFSGIDHFRYAMTKGKVREWFLLNTDTVTSHPVHIHINHFQVISYNEYTGGFSTGFSPDYILYNQDDGKPCYYQREGIEAGSEAYEGGELDNPKHNERWEADDGNTLAYARAGEWRDTLLVPPLGNITIRTLPERYVGTVIIHCHILRHEDEGMMMVVRIVGNGKSLAANMTSGSVYPGTCRKCDKYLFNDLSVTECGENPDPFDYHTNYDKNWKKKSQKKWRKRKSKWTNRKATEKPWY